MSSDNPSSLSSYIKKRQLIYLKSVFINDNTIILTEGNAGIEPGLPSARPLHINCINLCKFRKIPFYKSFNPDFALAKIYFQQFVDALKDMYYT